MKKIYSFECESREIFLDSGNPRFKTRFFHRDLKLLSHFTLVSYNMPMPMCTKSMRLEKSSWC